jgi:hypothetical protein
VVKCSVYCLLPNAYCPFVAKHGEKGVRKGRGRDGAVPLRSPRESSHQEIDQAARLRRQVLAVREESVDRAMGERAFWHEHLELAGSDGVGDQIGVQQPDAAASDCRLLEREAAVKRHRRRQTARAFVLGKGVKPLRPIGPFMVAAQTAVALQIPWSERAAMVRQIARRGDEDEAVFDETSLNELRVGENGNPNGDIEAVLKHVGECLAAVQVHFDVRVELLEVHKGGREIKRAECRRGRHPQQALRLGMILGDFTFRLMPVIEQGGPRAMNLAPASVGTRRRVFR